MSESETRDNRQQSRKDVGKKTVLTGMRKFYFSVEDMRGHHVALAVNLIFAEHLYYKNLIKSVSNPANKKCENIRAHPSKKTGGESSALPFGVPIMFRSF